MKKITLFSQSKSTINQACDLPVLGLVKFDSDNSIEIELEDGKLKEFRSYNCGVELFTKEELTKKREDIKQKKLDINNTDNSGKKTILSDHQKHPVVICLHELKSGRDADDLKLLHHLINEASQFSYKEMLDSLDRDDLDELLSNYKAEEIEKLKSTQSKIDFLLKNMK